MLNKTALADRILDRPGLDGFTRRDILDVLDGLKEVATAEVEAGNDFRVPGVVDLKFRYTPAQKKGDKFRKGDTVLNSFTGEEEVKEADSPAKKARIRLVGQPVGDVGKLKPGSKPEAQSEYLKSKTGRAVVRRKTAAR